MPRTGQRFLKTILTQSPLLWALLRIGRTSSMETRRQEVIEEDHCFEVMTRVWVDSSAKYEFEYAQSTVNDVNLP